MVICDDPVDSTRTLDVIAKVMYVFLFKISIALPLTPLNLHSWLDLVKR